jgi:hypothetical protein
VTSDAEGRFPTGGELSLFEAVGQIRLATPATAPPGRRNIAITINFLRHAHAVEMAHEGVPLVVIQRQLGHSNLGITSIYLQGIDNAEIIDTVHARPTPTVQVNALLSS